MAQSKLQNKLQNKVQYQRGLSMPEFFDRYDSPQQCEALVRVWRWPQVRRLGGHRRFL